MSYQLHNRSRSLRSLCGSVIEHRSAESEGLRFDSSWGLRIFSLSHARQKTYFSISLPSSKLTISLISTIITLSTLLILVSGMNAREQHCFLKRLSCRITFIDNSCYFVLLLQFFSFTFMFCYPENFLALVMQRLSMSLIRVPVIINILRQPRSGLLSTL